MLPHIDSFAFILPGHDEISVGVTNDHAPHQEAGIGAANDHQIFEFPIFGFEDPLFG